MIPRLRPAPPSILHPHPHPHPNFPFLLILTASLILLSTCTTALIGTKHASLASLEASLNATVISPDTILSTYLSADPSQTGLVVSTSIYIANTSACAQVANSSGTSTEDKVLGIYITKGVSEGVSLNSSAVSNIWWTICESKFPTITDGDTNTTTSFSTNTSASACPSTTPLALSTFVYIPAALVNNSKMSQKDMVNELFQDPQGYAIQYVTECSYLINNNSVFPALVEDRIEYGSLFAPMNEPVSPMLIAPTMTPNPALNPDIEEDAAAGSTGYAWFGVDTSVVDPSSDRLLGSVELYLPASAQCQNVTGSPATYVLGISVHRGNATTNGPIWWKLCAGGSMADPSVSACEQPNVNSTNPFLVTYEATPQDNAENANLTHAERLRLLYTLSSEFYISLYTNCSQSLANGTDSGLMRSQLFLNQDDLDLIIQREQGVKFPVTSMGNTVAEALINVEIQQGGTKRLILDPAWILDATNSSACTAPLVVDVIQAIYIRQAESSSSPTVEWVYCADSGFGFSDTVPSCSTGQRVNDVPQVLIQVSNEASIASLYMNPQSYELVFYTRCSEFLNPYASRRNQSYIVSTVAVDRVMYSNHLSSSSIDVPAQTFSSQYQIQPTGLVAVQFYVSMSFGTSSLLCKAASFERYYLEYDSSVNGTGLVQFCDSSLNSTLSVCPEVLYTDSNLPAALFSLSTLNQTSSMLFRDLARDFGNFDTVLVQQCTNTTDNVSLSNELKGIVANTLIFVLAEMQPNRFANPDISPSVAGNSTANGTVMFDAISRVDFMTSYYLDNNTEGCSDLLASSQQLISVSLSQGFVEQNGPMVWSFCNNLAACPAELSNSVLFKGSYVGPASDIAESTRVSMNTNFVRVMNDSEGYYVQMTTLCSNATRQGSSLLRVQMDDQANPSPDVLPTFAPTRTPDLSTPTPTSNPCWPGDAIVDLEDGSSKSMFELEIGDRVLVSLSKGEEVAVYSEVYFFGHRDHEGSYPFLTITLESGAKLSISEKHLVVVVADFNPMIPAGKLKRGDLLYDTKVGQGSPVVSIERNMKRGLFNPHTMEGLLVVDGILCSTYTSLVHPKLAHMLLLPERLAYVFKVSLLGRMLDRATPKLAVALMKMLYIIEKSM